MRKLIIALVLLASSSIKAQTLPYVNHTEAGILTATGNGPSFTAQMFNGVRIDKWKLEAGITTGVDIYQEVTLLPVSLGLKYNPLNNLPLSPFISMNAGYGFDWLQRQSANTKYGGGYVLHPSLGVRIKTKSSNQVSLGLGFRQQRAVIRQSIPSLGLFYDSVAPMPDMQSKEEYKFRRVSLSFGITL